MKLKKINATLQKNLEEHGFVEPTILQKKTFGKIKSGQDLVIMGAEGSGKTLAMIIGSLQRVEDHEEGMIATRVLIVVKDKHEVERLVELIKGLSRGTEVRVYGVHDFTDLDEDKNMLSLGNDILIGTANRLNDMFSGAGFDVNQLKMYLVDDLDVQLRVRLENRLGRLSESIGKTQRVYFTTVEVERMEPFCESTMLEDMEWLDFTEE